MTSVVYFAGSGDAIKIGFTSKLKQRIQVLQTSSSTEIKLLGSMAGDVAVERALHLRLAHYRRRGEWFTDCPEVRSVIVAAVGHDIFEKEAPAPCEDLVPEGPSAQEIADAKYDAALDRIKAFQVFCLNGSRLIHGLPTVRQHLLFAALRYTWAKFKEHAEFLDDPEVSEGDASLALDAAIAISELAEEQVCLICGDEFAHLMAGWERSQPTLLNLDGNCPPPNYSTLDVPGRRTMTSAPSLWSAV